ncbi:MAG: hypothetical protein ACK578_16000 [Pirellula sp.]
MPAELTMTFCFPDVFTTIGEDHEDADGRSVFQVVPPVLIATKLVGPFGLEELAIEGSRQSSYHVLKDPMATQTISCLIDWVMSLGCECFYSFLERMAVS